jgi:hypothetical protein
MGLEKRYFHKQIKEKWFKIEDEGSDFYCRFYIDGKLMTDVRSKAGGHSAKKYRTLHDDIVSRIVKCLHFDNKDQFLKFVDCPFTKEQYQDMLFQKRFIGRT